MVEYLEFQSKVNHPLPIDLGDGESISVAAKGKFRCTEEQADSVWVRREKTAGRIIQVHPDVHGAPKEVRVPVAENENSSYLGEQRDVTDGIGMELGTDSDYQKDDNSLTSTPKVVESEEETFHKEVRPRRSRRTQKKRLSDIVTLDDKKTDEGLADSGEKACDMETED